MIIEWLQLLDFLSGKVHFLILFCLTSLIFYLGISLKARQHHPFTGNFTSATTTIIPVYHEDPTLFRSVLEAIRPQTTQLIVVIDDANQRLRLIAEKYADMLFVNEKRQGKKRSISKVLNYALHPITILLDSDTIVEKNAVEEIIKPFQNSKIAIVQGQPRINNKNPGNFLAKKLSELTERSRDVICSALDPYLIVVDGRFQAVRTAILKKINQEWLNDVWFNKPSEIGEDRCRTRIIYKLGYKAAYQPTGVCYTVAPLTLQGFLKQQLRWFRSGYKFFLKDILERNFPSKTYLVQSLFFYLSPIVFTLVMLGDYLITPPLPYHLPLVIAPLIIVIGTGLITLLKQGLYFGFRDVEYRYILLYGIVGLLLLYPLMLYALCTNKNQESWITR